MSKYLELKRSHQKELNDFPIGCAFNDQQFEEMMTRFGLTINDTDKIYSLPANGCFVRKTDSAALKAMFNRHAKEMQDAIDDDTTGDGFIYQMFDYELSNHEYVITGDVSDTLDALGLEVEEVNANPALLHGLNKAIKAQRDCF